MKQYLLTEELWKTILNALSNAPYNQVYPIVEKLKTDLKVVMPNPETPVAITEATSTTEVINEQTNDSAS